jgi:hypothetical protein
MLFCDFCDFKKIQIQLMMKNRILALTLGAWLCMTLSAVGQTKIMVAPDEMMDGAVLPQKNATAQLDKSLMDAGYELSDCCSTITAAILNFNDTVTPNSPTFLSKVKPIR